MSNIINIIIAVVVFGSFLFILLFYYKRFFEVLKILLVDFVLSLLLTGFALYAILAPLQITLSSNFELLIWAIIYILFLVVHIGIAPRVDEEKY
ncbi:MAG: hypothetical protein ACP5LH_03590 [Candidatus Micrarchaeia archaeon]